MTKLITIAALKKQLKQLNHEELMDLILELNKLNKLNQEYLTTKLSPSADLSEIKDDYENKIYKILMRNGAFNTKIKEAKTLIDNFLKISNSNELSVDLMVFYVETCVELLDLGVKDEKVIKTAIDVFGDIIASLNGEDHNTLYKKYQQRLESIVKDTLNINYWLYEAISETYYCDLAWYEDTDDDEEEITD